MPSKPPVRPTRQIQQNAKNLRKPLTPPEAKLWKQLRGRRLGGYKFRRQHPIGRFIVDFYCAKAKLVIELDGRPHDEQAEYDALRTAWLEANGYTVIRFSNSLVNENLHDVVRTILVKCHELTGCEDDV